MDNNAVKKTYKTRSQSPEKKQAQFNQILEVSQKIIAEKGIDGFSLRKLAKILEMNQSNLFNYVKNKRELIIAIRNKYYELLKTENREIIKKTKSPYKALIKIFRNYLDFATRKPWAFNIMFFEPIPDSNETGPIETAYSPFNLLSGTSRLFKKCIDAGEIVNKDPNKLAYLTFSLLLGATRGEFFLESFEEIEGFEEQAVNENIDYYQVKLGSQEFREYVIDEIKILLKKK